MSGAESRAARFSTGVSEVVLAVDDVAAVARFYEEIVGLVPESVGESGAWLWTGEPGESARLGLASRSQPPLSARADRFRIGERPAAEESRTDPLDFAPADLGPTHFALRVPRERFDAAVERLRRHGVTVAGPLEFRWMRARSCFFRDPEGNPVELWSPDA